MPLLQLSTGATATAAFRQAKRLVSRELGFSGKLDGCQHSYWDAVALQCFKPKAIFTFQPSGKIVSLVQKEKQFFIISSPLLVWGGSNISFTEVKVIFTVKM